MGGLSSVFKSSDKQIEYFIQTTKFTKVWNAYKTSASAGVSHADEDHWVSELIELLKAQLGDDFKHNLDFLIEVDPITRNDATPKEMEKIYKTFIKSGSVNVGFAPLKKAFTDFSFCKWKTYDLGYDRKPRCSGTLIASSEAIPTGGDVRKGLWKRAEAAVISQISPSFDSLKETASFKTFLETHKDDISPFFPELFGASTAHLAQYNELELEYPSLFDHDDSNDYHYSVGYNHDVYSHPLAIDGDSNKYFHGLMVGGLIGGGAIIFILVVFCMGLAIGMAIYRAYMQREIKELEKENVAEGNQGIGERECCR
eukprot:632924_1